jgi:hypothetical protein
MFRVESSITGLIFRLKGCALLKLESSQLTNKTDRLMKRKRLNSVGL